MRATGCAGGARAPGGFPGDTGTLALAPRWTVRREGSCAGGRNPLWSPGVEHHRRKREDLRALPVERRRRGIPPRPHCGRPGLLHPVSSLSGQDRRGHSRLLRSSGDPRTLETRPLPRAGNGEPKAHGRPRRPVGDATNMLGAGDQSCLLVPSGQRQVREAGQQRMQMPRRAGERIDDRQGEARRNEEQIGPSRRRPQPVD